MLRPPVGESALRGHDAGGCSRRSVVPSFRLSLRSLSDRHLPLRSALRPLALGGPAAVVLDGRSWESFLVFTTCHVGPARVPLSVPPHGVPAAPVPCAGHSSPRKASFPPFAAAEGYFGVSPRPCAASSGCWMCPCPLSALARAWPCPFPAGGAAVLPREERSPFR